jgi:hypothetical protein
MWKVCWNKGRLYWKTAKFFISVTLKSWSGRKILDPTTYSPQHPILKYPQPTFLPQCGRPRFTLIHR